MDRLIERLQAFGSPRIALVGDFMLDRYVYGNVDRINPEAPVPILQTVRAEARVGGTGNVALAAMALGADVRCVGVIGRDPPGEDLRRMLMDAGANTASLIRLNDRPTSVKTRYVGLAQHRHPQQILRVDEEKAEPAGAKAQSALRAALRAELAQAAVVTLEDYDKGVLTDDSAPALIADARAAGKTVIVDPACIADYRRYRNATLLKPNRFEAALASGVKITDDSSLAEAARRLAEVTDAQAIVVTLDSDGAYVHPRDGTPRRVPHHRPRSVYDVSGAGDETLAVLSVALAEGCDWQEAAELANVAGGLEVERFGFVPVTRREMIEELRRMIGLRGSKVVDRRRLAEELAARRQRGQTIVFTNGCFDLLHLGHTRYLQQARELGHCLVVAVNGDAGVRRLKGPGRPVIAQIERAEMLAALECVDYVTVFEEDTPEPLLELLRPDILVKGGTTGEVVGQRMVEGWGGKVLKLEPVEDLSTTKIINRILETHTDK